MVPAATAMMRRRFAGHNGLLHRHEEGGVYVFPLRKGEEDA
jgi:hypothetical protein